MNKSHNLLTKNEIKAYIRISPPNPFYNQYRITLSSIGVFDKEFSFDGVYPTNTTQRELYKSICEQIAVSTLEGYNGSIIAYGQTASGKTYSMFGNLNNDIDWGILPHLLVFYLKKNMNYVLKCSFIEIYNEIVMDLFDQSKVKTVREDTDNSIFVENLTEVTIHSVEEGLDYVMKGLQNRKTSETKMNRSSSRSHSIFRIKYFNNFIYRIYDNDYHYISLLNCVDLAGSERIFQSEVTGDRLKEANCINKSLSQLGLVILSLCNNNKIIHYRDSKLTLLLKESLCGNSNTAMIGTISLDKQNISETISTLSFIQRAKGVKTIIKKVDNSKNDELEFLRKEVYKYNILE